VNNSISAAKFSAFALLFVFQELSIAIPISLAFSGFDQSTAWLFAWQSYLSSGLLKSEAKFRLDITKLTYNREAFVVKKRGLTPFFVGSQYTFQR
jgi:hypothetical protein